MICVMKWHVCFSRRPWLCEITSDRCLFYSFFAETRGEALVLLVLEYLIPLSMHLWKCTDKLRSYLDTNASISHIGLCQNYHIVVEYDHHEHGTHRSCYHFIDIGVVERLALFGSPGREIAFGRQTTEREFFQGSSFSISYW
jgi:hypothetical protein